MRRTILCRGLVVLASAIAVIVGCTETPTDGGLPPTKGIATAEDQANLQKKLLQEKVSSGAKYTPPPGVNIPKK